MNTPKTIGVEELATILQRAVATVKTDVSRRPETLPPRLAIPGTRTPIWLLSDVLDWLERHRTAPRVHKHKAK